eukprot:gnl/Hemi2/9169_TR3192_c0_g1_i1.p1 gnl/Hemi2/9169_TR3192_c0_g1~~gnl/Hemi2/9169_TR3192_c0_g1_i1.p1  ORF type:complete len:258 (+),score=44.37 gnl/Hemi2/9169_TR3192_c0_g1_i1:99-776(+)
MADVFPLEKVVKFCGQLDGRDKIFRATQYAARISTLFFRPDSLKLKRFLMLSSLLTDARRVFRIFSEFSELQKINLLSKEPHQLVRMMQLIRGVSMIVYVWFDRCHWVQSKNLLELHPRTNFQWYANVFWLSSVLSSLAADATQYSVVQHKLRKLGPHDDDQRKALTTQRHLLILNTYKNLGDLPILVNSVFVPRSGKSLLPDWLVGLCGVVSSTVGGYMVWLKL